MAIPPVETYPALAALGLVKHGFVGRVAEVPLSTDKREMIAALDEHHAAARVHIGLGGHRPITAEQVHGAAVAMVDSESGTEIAAVDGLITRDGSVCLGIYVADCCAVYVADPVQRAIGLLHSGKKGTELGILPAAIERMQQEFGSIASDLVVQLSPCIRPPHYEIDFAATIIGQAREMGVRDVLDSGANTGADLERYYSYRIEKGRTGRMVAYLGLA